MYKGDCIFDVIKESVITALWCCEGKQCILVL